MVSLRLGSAPRERDRLWFSSIFSFSSADIRKSIKKPHDHSRMKLFTAVYATISCLFVSSTCAASTTNEGWSYRANDPVTHGPADWGAEFPVCAGSRQSPIDITQRDACGEEKRRAPLSFAGECSNFHIKQLYESYKAEIANGSCTVLAKDKSYNFAQVHFHAPSEHTLNGKTFDGEVHFVHQAADGNILVVGLFLTKKQGVITDPFVTKFWRALQQVSTTNPVDVALGTYASLLKSKTSNGRAYNYPGSLTTPACSETVDWWVLERALPVAAADFASFQTSLARIGAAANGTNARPVQALNGRSIIVY